MSRQPPTDAQALAHLRRSVQLGTLDYPDMAALREVYVELARQAAHFAAQYPTMAAELPIMGQLARDHALLGA